MTTYLHYFDVIILPISLLYFWASVKPGLMAVGCIKLLQVLNWWIYYNHTITYFKVKKYIGQIYHLTLLLIVIYTKKGTGSNPTNGFDYVVLI